MRERCNVAYAILMEEIPAERRTGVDEMLEEAYLEEIPAGMERERERARRKARELGIDQRGALAAMSLPQAGSGPVVPR